MRSESEQEQTNNRYGTFTYLSLADFEAEITALRAQQTDHDTGPPMPSQLVPAT